MLINVDLTVYSVDKFKYWSAMKTYNYLYNKVKKKMVANNNLSSHVFIYSDYLRDGNVRKDTTDRFDMNFMLSL